MVRWLKRIGVVVVLLVLAVAAAFALSRWLGPTDEQERALAVMAAWEPPAGRNAFGALWLMPYEIPAGERREILERDLQRYAGRAKDDLSRFVSAAHGHFADLRDSKDTWPPLCRRDAAQCLQDVSARSDEYAAWREQHAALVERAALGGVDHYGNPFVSRVDRPTPDFGLSIQVRRTSHALDFVQGRRQAAFDGVCGDIATWRQLGANAGTLLGDMLAASVVESSGLLLAHMLAQSPGTEPLPASCKLALAPPSVQELSLCRAMRGEFAYVQEAAFELPASWAYDPRMTKGRSAMVYAQACTPAMEQAIALDRPLPPLPPLPSRFSFQCIGNAAGCILTDIAAPAYRDYFERAQGYGAKLRLLSTLYWLHTTAGRERPLEQKLATRPAELRSPRHPVEVVHGGDALRIAVPSNGEPHWQLPLSPALR